MTAEWLFGQAHQYGYRGNVQPVLPGGGALGGTSFWTSPDEKALALRWLLGLSGTWIILTLMVDLGDTSELAVALALTITGSVLLAYGPQMFQSLGISTQPPSASPSTIGA